ncbi:Peptidase M23 [Pseudodesulfovibrio profundus]|uniref:Peptidase M23 n=1 Tax=Pseudodesulfovibrio profundus TaxID=57320 RepID=A0A2C8F4C2_9BACT|nr:peptidoglycan DD-metalloendopeptidase family protein [Pseudodesulfovibrio profundus]SOB57256.1 Peptidase M23 [Pseudodesulfovibrio profundus]
MKIPFLICTLLLLLHPYPSFAEDKGEVLHESLQRQHQEADDKELRVRELTKQAGKISTQLSDIEHDIRLLQKKINDQESTLAAIRGNEQEARKAHYALEEEKKKIMNELRSLLQALWPVHMQSIQSKFKGTESWDMFDRRFNWLSDIYGAATEKLKEARVNSGKISRNLERQRLLEEEAQAQLTEVNKSKDRLLNSKLALRKRLRVVRNERQNTEKELSEILDTIQELKYQLQSQKTKQFGMYKRSLPWPVDGRIVSGFNLKAKPPVRGWVLSANDTANVQSVFWGKVVHNDTLRGFGHVIIVYNGYDYYSLYAYLSETFVRNGQEVEKNEPLGVVGYNPKTGGPGLYFELRFHQKPINPKLWLTTAKR